MLAQVLDEVQAGMDGDLSRGSTGGQGIPLRDLVQLPVGDEVRWLASRALNFENVKFLLCNPIEDCFAIFNKVAAVHTCRKLDFFFVIPENNTNSRSTTEYCNQFEKLSFF